MMKQYVIFFLVALHIQTAPGLRITPFQQQGAADFNTATFDVDEWQKAWDARMASFDAMENFQEVSDKTEHNNLCIDGHLAPEFYLLGAQKAATTSFSAMLANPSFVLPQVLSGEPRYYKKELHIFNNDKRFAMGKGFWLSHYPECTTKMRKVAVDMTPNYLFTHNDDGPNTKFFQAVVPKRMQEFYGDQSHKLKFASILRNPTERIQSCFHFYQGKGWCEQKHINNGFKAYVEELMNGNDPCHFLWDSQYHRQVGHYLEVFNSTQLITFPMLEIIAPPDAATSTEANVAALEPLGIQAKPAPIVHSNRVEHVSMADELGDELMEKFQTYVDQHVSARMVAKLHLDHGIKVFGYNGPATVTALGNWIKTRW